MPAWVNNPPLDLHVIYGVGADVRHDRERAMIDARHDIARQDCISSSKAMAAMTRTSKSTTSSRRAGPIRASWSTTSSCRG